MIILKTIKEVKNYISPIKEANKTIGFVPTMGALHKGHLALGIEAKKQSNIVIYSIFINPTQFAPGEDLEKYPKEIETDIKKLESIGVDALFLPESKEIYQENSSTFVTVNKLGNILCGKTRPTHFTGVTTIVMKLFNITECNKAFFGKKDYQQFIILKKMVDDLDINVELTAVEIERETDGLALSSRNKYLNTKERNSALILSKALKHIEENYKSYTTKTELLETTHNYIKTNEPNVDIEYIELRDFNNLDQIAEKLNSEMNLILLLAVKVGNTRLIDNKIM